MGKWRRKKSLSKRWAKSHLIKKHGNICYLCTLPMEKMKDITIDHVIPISKGGMDELENYMLAHFGCNNLKNNLSIEEFQQFQRGELVWEEPEYANE
jgi:5-methylcytosine-specific restriction endonuclease McrA